MSSGTFTLAYDATRPTAAGTLARAPNANGWFNQAVALNVTGSDATSGIASRSGGTYGGPDGTAREVSGTCTDRAGNTSVPTSRTLNYDATPPATTGSSPARPADRNGWYNQPVALSVSGTDATSGIGSCGGPSYSGPDGLGPHDQRLVHGPGREHERPGVGHDQVRRDRAGRRRARWRGRPTRTAGTTRPSAST